MHILWRWGYTPTLLCLLPPSRYFLELSQGLVGNPGRLPRPGYRKRTSLWGPKSCPRCKDYKFSTHLCQVFHLPPKALSWWFPGHHALPARPTAQTFHGKIYIQPREQAGKVPMLAKDTWGPRIGGGIHQLKMKQTSGNRHQEFPFYFHCAELSLPLSRWDDVSTGRGARGHTSISSLVAIILS